MHRQSAAAVSLYLTFVCSSCWASSQNKALADGQAASSVSTLYKDDIAVTCHFPAGQFNHSAQGVAKWTDVLPVFQHRSEEIANARFSWTKQPGKRRDKMNKKDD